MTAMASGALQVGPAPDPQGHREQAEHGRHGRHHDRPQTNPPRLDNRVTQGTARIDGPD